MKFKQFKIIIFLLVCIFGSFGCENGNFKEKLNLFLKEKNNTCHTVKIVGNPEYYPFSFVDNGELKGKAVEIMNRVLSMDGVKADLVHSFSWTDSVAMVEEGKADILVGAYYSKDINFLNYIEPYLEQDEVMIFAFDRKRKSEKSNTIAILNSIKKTKELEKTYKDYKFNNFSSAEEVFAETYNGNADFGVARYNAIMNYARKNLAENSIKIIKKWEDDKKLYAAFSTKSKCRGLEAKIAARIAEFKNVSLESNSSKEIPSQFDNTRPLSSGKPLNIIENIKEE